MLFWLSVAGLGLLWFGWLSALVKMLRGIDDVPEQWKLDEGVEPDPIIPAQAPLGLAESPAPSLSLVVPARNEVHNIERCVTALLAVDWPGELQVVVVDDRSTDGTTEALAAIDDARLTVVEGKDPPKGWLGKPHALHLAQQHATGDWLLFIDADVVIDPLGPRRLIGRVIAQGAEMASSLGKLLVETFWERVLQTRVGAIIAGGNPLDEVNDPEHERALANGQCLLFKREAYDRMGGHEAIQGSVLDDVDFAKLAKAEGVVYRLYYAPGVFACRMYTGLREIWNGWTKNLFPALEYKVHLVAIVTGLLFVVCLLPFVLLAKNGIVWGLGGAVDPVFVAMEAGMCLTIFAVDALGHRINGYKWGLFWTFPLGMGMVLALFWYSAWRIKSGKGAVWKGRVVEAGRS